METRIAAVSILVEDAASVEVLNSVLHQYAPYILGRMGIPYREKNVNIISIAMDAPLDVINSMTGKIGRLPGVTAKATSELTFHGHHRGAHLAVDGTGLEVDPQKGWAALGAPFYSGAVDYTQTVTKTTDKTFVALPPIREGWNGAVAAVLVNGTQVGTIALRDDLVDISPALRDGENEVTVRIYGTPKNQYGPHHKGRLRGSAWPGSFHGAPATMPSGTAYDVIPYGIF